MKALISPNEIRSYQTGWTNDVPPKPIIDGSGYRVAQTSPDEYIFPVGDPLYWAACPDDVMADAFVFNPNDNEFHLVMLEPI